MSADVIMTFEPHPAVAVPHTRFWPDYDRRGESTHQRSSPENPTSSSLMSSAAQQKQKHLEVEVLSGEAQKVLTECGRQLEAAPFKDNGKFEFIEARATLEEASRDFVKMQSKVRAYAISDVEVTNLQKPDCRVIAWRFSRAMTLSIPPKVTLDLIPFQTSETATVGGISVKVGNNIHLTKDVDIRPFFICLVRVYGPTP